MQEQLQLIKTKDLDKEQQFIFCCGIIQLSNLNEFQQNLIVIMSFSFGQVRNSLPDYVVQNLHFGAGRGCALVF